MTAYIQSSRWQPHTEVRLDWTTTGLLLALLVTQIVAFPCALICARFSGNVSDHETDRGLYRGLYWIALFAIQLDKQWEFWTLAVWSVCSRERSRRWRGPILRRSFRQKSPGNILGSTISAGKEHPLWGRP